jgi:hypothetical protein
MKVVRLFTFATLIQLCPAPFVPAILEAAATAAVALVPGSGEVVEAGLAGAEAAGGAGAAAAARDIARTAINSVEEAFRKNSIRSTQPTKESLQACWLETLKVAPQVVFHNESTITLTGLHSCWHEAVKGGI